jgi:carboxymethylenebutenolidase
MNMSQQPVLTAAEQLLNDAWEEHLRTAFYAHSADEALVTMIENPLVNQVPVLIGGNGKEELYQFYATYFLPQIPPDIEMVPVSRTIGQGRLVEEMVVRFTHTIPMAWMLPGIPPTGKRVEVAMLVVVQFDGDKLAHEHLYWDQASVLVQLGLLQRDGLPVVGVESARSVLDRSIRLNALIRQLVVSRGEGTVEAIMTSDRSSAGDWKGAFANRTAAGFADAFAEDIVLEATTLNRPVRGREQVKVVMAAASKLYKSVAFTATATGGAKQYLEWVAEAHAGVQFGGVTVLTRDPTGAIVHIAIHHRPMEAAIFFSETMDKSLRGELDATYFLNEHTARQRENR